MRKWELIIQSKLLKIKSDILSNLFNEKYGLKLREFNNTTGTETVDIIQMHTLVVVNPHLKLEEHISRWSNATRNSAVARNVSRFDLNDLLYI